MTRQPAVPRNQRRSAPLLRRLLPVVCIVLMMVPGALHAVPAEITLPVYSDALAPGWADWSWNATLDFNAPDPVSGGADRAIRVTYTDPWGGVSLRHAAIAVSPYDSLRFAIHGGGSGGQALQVALELSDGGPPGPFVPLNDYLPPGGVPANTWAAVTIPLADLLPVQATSFARIDWQNLNGGAAQTFYLDDIRLSGPDAGPPTLTVHTLQGLRHIPSRLYGSNAAYWGGNIQALPDVVAKLQASGLTVLRYPGGSSSDEYHWADWDPGNAGNAWAMNTTEFMGMVGTLGAEAMFTANFGTGSAAEAAAWVRFTNVTHNWHVPYWEIGNEVYGAWETSWTHDGTAYMLGDASHDGANAFCAAMKAVDPTIRVGIVGTLNAVEYSGWGPAVLSHASPCIDFYVIHRYPLGPGNRDYQQVLADPPMVWPAVMADVRAMLQIYAPARHLDIAATEYNIYYTEPEALQGQVVNLLYLADSQGQLIRQGAAYANQWDIVNGQSSNGGDYGLLLNGDNYRRTPGYYAYPLWRHFGDQLLALDNTGSPLTTLSAYASLAGDGLVLTAINKSNQALPATLVLEDFVPSGSGAAFVAQGATLDATTITYNGNPNPPLDLRTVPALPVSGVASSFAYTFPALSVTSLRLFGAPRCVWSDVDCDGLTQTDDLAALGERWGSEEGDPGWNARFDINADGMLDVVDIQIAALNWVP